MLKLWYSPIYSDGIDAQARFPRLRYKMLFKALEKEPGISFHLPAPIERQDIIRAHCPDYVQRFLSGGLTEREIRRIGLRPWTDKIIDRTLILTGGTLWATQHAWKNKIAGHIAGGTHHAHYDYGSGYCIFNDLAIGARWLQSRGVKRILILDLDVHQGDGTASIFHDDPTVFTLSVHCASNFPFHKQKSDLDVALKSHTQDRTYLEALSCIPKVLDTFRPEFVFFQAGVDPLECDKLGKLNITRAGLQKRNRYVFEQLSSRRIPVVITMGGGYAQPLSKSVEAHCDVFIQAAHFAHPCFF